MRVVGSDAVGEPAGRVGHQPRAGSTPRIRRYVVRVSEPGASPGWVSPPACSLPPKRCGALAKQRCDRLQSLCHNPRMHRSFVAEFAARRAAIKHAWERKLRCEPVTSPLANPDTLVLLMDRTLEDLAAALSLRCRAPGPEPLPSRPLRAGCLCGLNPLLAYFRIAASVLPGVMAPRSERFQDLDTAGYAACLQELHAELQTLASVEIRSFCATCQTEIVRDGRTPASVAAEAPTAASARKPLAPGQAARHPARVSESSPPRNRPALVRGRPRAIRR